LLLAANYYGTLAAARAVGAQGVPVVVADEERVSTARWSRYVSRYEICPPILDTTTFVSWLMDYGARNPGTVLYATSDGVAWIIADHGVELARHFRLYQPGRDVAFQLLDKKTLYETARQVGLGAPDTWFPHCLADLARIARTASYPLLIKPRTQVLSRTLTKGVIVERWEDLDRLYQDFRAANRFAPALTKIHPDIDFPMLQAFHDEAAEGIYALSGFIDRSGRLVAMRAASKVLQWPRRLGLGLCYEHAEIDADAAEKVLALCRATGHYGVFEAELIRHEGRLLLLDFNPRFYGQMVFDVVRGASLPLMAYHAATGNQAALEREVAQAAAWRADGRRYAYCNTFDFILLLLAQRLSTRLTKEEYRSWRAWYRENRPHLVDSTWSTNDLLPGLVAMGRALSGHARGPAGFIRTIILDRPSLPPARR
jgi:predicted ATP-grasp superfamily ATP-dependent carboligase